LLLDFHAEAHLGQTIRIIRPTNPRGWGGLEIGINVFVFCKSMSNYKTPLGCCARYLDTITNHERTLPCAVGAPPATGQCTRWAHHHHVLILRVSLNPHDETCMNDAWTLWLVSHVRPHYASRLPTSPLTTPYGTLQHLTAPYDTLRHAQYVLKMPKTHPRRTQDVPKTPQFSLMTVWYVSLFF